MKYDDRNEKLVFETTGREVVVNRGIVGLSEKDSDVFYGGYDDHYRVDGLTAEEREELADYMIELWTRFKEMMR